MASARLLPTERRNRSEWKQTEERCGTCHAARSESPASERIRKRKKRRSIAQKRRGRRGAEIFAPIEAACIAPCPPLPPTNEIPFSSTKARIHKATIHTGPGVKRVKIKCVCFPLKFMFTHTHLPNSFAREEANCAMRARDANGVRVQLGPDVKRTTSSEPQQNAGGPWCGGSSPAHLTSTVGRKHEGTL